MLKVLEQFPLINGRRYDFLLDNGVYLYSGSKQGDNYRVGCCTYVPVIAADLDRTSYSIVREGSPEWAAATKIVGFEMIEGGLTDE